MQLLCKSPQMEGIDNHLIFKTSAQPKLNGCDPQAAKALKALHVLRNIYECHFAQTQFDDASSNENVTLLTSRIFF